MTECPPGVHSLFDFCPGDCTEPVEDDVPVLELCGAHIGPEEWQWCVKPPRHVDGCALEYDPKRAGDEFDALLRASEERAQAKRAARLYPYDLEVGQ